MFVHSAATAAGSGFGPGFGLRGSPRQGARLDAYPACVVVFPAAGAAPKRIAGGLQAPLFDGAPATRVAALAGREASRGFGEGCFFLPGQVVDRRA